MAGDIMPRPQNGQRHRGRRFAPTVANTLGAHWPFTGVRLGAGFCWPAWCGICAKKSRPCATSALTRCGDCASGARNEVRRERYLSALQGEASDPAPWPVLGVLLHASDYRAVSFDQQVRAASRACAAGATVRARPVHGVRRVACASGCLAQTHLDTLMVCMVSWSIGKTGVATR
jgi:hypothetical protein